MSRVIPSRNAVAGVAVAVGVLVALAALPEVAERTPPPWLLAAATGLAGGALWLWRRAMRTHDEELKMIAAALHAVADGRMPAPEMLDLGRNGDPAIAAMAEIVAEIGTRRASEATLPDQRLAAIIAAIEDGVVVVTEAGLISLINGSARQLLGARVALGTSIFGAIDRDGLVAAMHRAQRSAGVPVTTQLHATDGRVLSARLSDFGEHRGAVIILPAAEAGRAGAVELALDLHDQPPPAPPPVAATLLTELPALVLDTEATGLDVVRDAIVSIGAVRTHGSRIFRSATLDRLVDPQRHIPARATAVHGIDDAMVHGHPPIAATLPEVLAMMRGTVVVGHNIAFDLGLLANAAARAGLDWSPPPQLDIMLLAGAASPHETDLNLEAMARRLGINVSGRHTALGDALVTAELWVRMIHQLAARGVRTLGDAQAFAARARHILAHQRSMGWPTAPGGNE